MSHLSIDYKKVDGELLPRVQIYDLPFKEDCEVFLEYNLPAFNKHVGEHFRMDYFIYWLVQHNNISNQQQLDSAYSHIAMDYANVPKDPVRTLKDVPFFWDRVLDSFAIICLLQAKQGE